MIPDRGDRGNRQHCLGNTTSQAHDQKVKRPITEPHLIDGSTRYATTFVKMTNFCKKIHKDAGFGTPFFIPPGSLYHGREKYAKRIHVENVFDGLTFIIYIIDGDISDNTNDILLEHFDGGNCPIEGYDIAFVVWDTHYRSDLLCWVLTVFVAYFRKSISDLLLRSDTITRCGNELLRIYNAKPFHERYVTARSLCDPSKKCETRKVHSEVMVNISMVIWQIASIHKMLSNTFNTVMSIFLVVEMVIAFNCTNNGRKFVMASEAYCEHLETNGLNIDYKPVDFLEFYRGHIMKHHDSMDGYCNDDPNYKGAERCQGWTTRPKTRLQMIYDVQSLYKIIQQHRGKPPSFDSYTTIVKEIKTKVLGIGTLTVQKAVYALAAVGVFSEQYLRFSIPGSTQHFEKLKKAPYLCTKKEQVEQIQKYVCNTGDENGPIAGPKGDEIMCFELRDESKQKQYQDIVFPKEDIYFTRIDGSNYLKLLRMNYNTREEEPVLPLIFNWSTEEGKSHYIPRWSFLTSPNPMVYAGLDVFLVSKNADGDSMDLTMEGASKSKKKKTKMVLPTKALRASMELTTKQKPPSFVAGRFLDKLTSIGEFNFGQVNSSFMNTSKYEIIHDIEKFTANYLGISVENIRRLIKIKSCEGGGYIPKFRLKEKEVLNVHLENEPCQILDSPINRRPFYGTNMENINDQWKYSSIQVARHAGLIHVLLNFLPKKRPHWSYSMETLATKGECVVLCRFNEAFVPVTAMGALFRTRNGVFFKQFYEKNCTIFDAISLIEW